MKKLIQFAVMVAAVVTVTSCEETPRHQTSDEVQQNAQEQMLKDSTMQTGMPGIRNFQERKLLKLILEMRDQEGLVTYTYMENLVPTVVSGRTALGGKLTFIGVTVGFGIPYATQYTNPQKIAEKNSYQSGSYAILPQADPNGLFSPASADGTWILMKNPNGKETTPQYIEPKIAVFTFQLPFDGEPPKK